MITFKYKNGYIHDNFTDGIISLQLENEYNRIYVSSVQAAKIMITKLMKQRG